MQLAQAIVRVREMILRGELAAGERVAEAPLAELLGTSRTPIRQALPLLAQEGLLTEHPTRGYVVRAFTVADIIDALELRGVLEGIAARRVAERGLSKAVLRQLRDCLEEGDTLLAKRCVEKSDEASYAEMNRRFHALLVQEGAGRIVREALERACRVPFAAPQAVAFDLPDLAQVYDMLHYAHRQHHAIVEALEQGSAARAEALMREHAETVKQSISMDAFELAAGTAPGRIALVR